MLSDRARAYVREHGCQPPGWKKSKLVALARRQELPLFDSVVAWEKTMAELHLDESHEGEDGVRYCRHDYAGASVLELDRNVLGMVSLWERGLSGEPELFLRYLPDGTPVLLVGEGAEGERFYMDEPGRFFAHREGEWGLLALSPFTVLERWVLERAPRRMEAVILGRRGQQLARALGCEVCPEASDAIETWWRGGSGTVIEQGELATRALLPSIEEAAALIAAAREMDLELEIVAADARVVLGERDSAPLPRADGLEARYGRGRAGEFGVVGVVGVPGRGGQVEQLVMVGGGQVVEHLVVTANGARSMQYTLLGAQLDGLLSERAIAFLEASKATLDPRDRGTTDETEALLSSCGLSVHEAALDLESTLGGLSWDPGATAWRLGVCSLVRDAIAASGLSRLKRTWRGAPLVPVGSREGATLFMDAAGHIYQLYDEVERMLPSADSARGLIEREALLEWALDKELGHTLSFTVLDGVGTRLSARAGIPPVPEASSAADRVWHGRELTIHEIAAPEDGHRETCVWAASLETLVSAARMVCESAPEARLVCEQDSVTSALMEAGLVQSAEAGLVEEVEDGLMEVEPGLMEEVE